MATIISDDRDCKLRRRFDSKKHAQAAALRIFCNTNKQRIPEPCRHCHGWHLGESK